tara:strand:+ start:375 stop:818 length:444 start_codon:yes stop_codon:yes gene_type:complete
MRAHKRETPRQKEARRYLRARVVNADAHGQAHRVKKKDHVRRDRKGLIDQVSCKICGTIICSMIPGEHGPPVLMQTNQYTTIFIEFDDGSRYETPMCKVCAASVDADVLEPLYAADIDKWEKEGDNVNREAWWVRAAYRRPDNVRKG